MDNKHSMVCLLGSSSNLSISLYTEKQSNQKAQCCHYCYNISINDLYKLFNFHPNHWFICVASLITMESYKHTKHTLWSYQLYDNDSLSNICFFNGSSSR